MNRFTDVLFDLDGTLVDPGEGIAGTIQFVLDKLGVAAQFDGALRWYVGPPLTEIFGRVLARGRDSELWSCPLLLVRYPKKTSNAAG